MKSREHFMQMLLSLSEWEPGVEQSASIEALAEILCCTPRNVKLILRKWEKDGLLSWKAGVGRGNHSTLTILCDTSTFFSSYFQKLLADGKIGEAVALIQNRKLPPRLKRLLQEMWDSQFGFVAESGENTSLDVLRIPRQRDFSTLDPAFVAVASESHFLNQMCHRLVTYDRERQRFLPQLAYAWESNEQRTIWTFYLRKGVRFHHGRMLSSKDVAYTVQRLIDLDSPYRWQMDDVERIEHPSERVVTFHLRQPNRFFLHFMGSNAMSILPHDVPFDERAIVGTGPFRMAEYTDDRLVLEAFEDYYGERAMLDRVELWIVPGPYSRQRLYQLPDRGDTRPDTDGQEGDLVFEEVGCHYLAFNFRRPGVHHEYAFRMAMRLIIDRHELIRQLGEHGYTPAGSFLPQQSRSLSFPSSTLEEAADWLRRSSYRGEMLSLFMARGTTFDGIASWIRERCERVGIRLQIESLTKADFLSPDFEQKADMAIMGEVLQNDIELGLLEVYKNKCTMVHRFLDDAKREWIDGRLSEVLRMKGREKRLGALLELEETLAAEQCWLFLYHVKRVDRYHPDLQGFVADSYGWVDFSKLWVKSFVTRM
ncbi:ABC transporter substrate-binding protein [Brevibacillus brevis]|uniref:ABC transporter substrate-binding protein n=1 Tax=Brevibacillus brevis TaxID=1393 RepID=A0ABY9T4D5_BREBE|nr:ABC transporter substrate-binding protein [Brevibacillus brevis]WNC14965.1 ABC transporter substrate-binding protein [Brevibacillus brevis]